MKLNKFLIIGIAASVVSIFSCTNNKVSTITEKLDTVKVDSSFADTVGNKYTADAALFELSRDHSIALDSLETLRERLNVINLQLVKVTATKDSVIRVNISNKEKLGIAEYKLLRIREYNRIAAQGNNIKFLRGWIIRTLNH